MQRSARKFTWVARKEVFNEFGKLPSIEKKGDAENIFAFLRKRVEESIDTSLKISNIDNFAEEILKLEDENIILHGDYDVDGITSVAILSNIFEKLGKKSEKILPSRFESGYGIDIKKIKEKLDLSKKNIVFALDSGTNELDKISFLKKNGVQIYVIDHHEPESKDKEVDFPIINPKYHGTENAKILSTAGLCHVLAEKIFSDKDFLYDEIFPLSALGTVSDVSPMVGKNWQIVKKSLENFPGNNIGLKKLIEVSCINSQIKSYHLGFILGPKLNASGRIFSPNESLDLLLEKSEEKARILAEKLDFYNKERQKITKLALEKILEKIEDKDSKIFIFGDESFKKGVAGLVASEVVERFGGASFIYEKSGSVFTGSARSDGSIDVSKVLSNLSDVLISGGGHKLAGGFSLKREKEDLFKDRLNEICRENFKKVGRKLEVSFEISNFSQEILQFVFKKISDLEPFGPCNNSPKIIGRGLTLISEKTIGDMKNHQRVSFVKNQQILDGIQFDFPEKLKVGSRYDIVFSLSENNFEDGKFEAIVEDFRES